MPSKARLVLLPGLGADARLFEAQRSVVPDLFVPAWPTAKPGESLASFAARLVDSVPPSGDLYLGGCSFGGMVAMELAALVKPRAVILVGSCTHPDSIAPLVRSLRRVAEAAPVSWFHPRRWSLPFVLPKFGRLTREHRELFWSMASATPAGFLKWGVAAILSWQPTMLAIPVHHIHGSADRLIPVRLVRPTRVVPSGGHLLTLTHPNAVNAFLGEILSTAA